MTAPRPTFRPYVPPRHHDMSPGGHVELPADTTKGLGDSLAHIRAARGVLWGLFLTVLLWILLLVAVFLVGYAIGSGWR